MGSRVLILEKEQNEVDEVFEHFEESENIVVLSEFLRKEHDLNCMRTVLEDGAEHLLVNEQDYGKSPFFEVR